jgi:hypothetical protein
MKSGGDALLGNFGRRFPLAKTQPNLVAIARFTAFLRWKGRLFTLTIRF